MLGNCASFPALATLAFIVGCDQAADADLAPTATATTETFREFGDYVVHFNALSTDRLTPDIAREYDIIRSRNRGLLTVSVLRTDDSAEHAVRGDVSVSAVNLTGQLKGMTMREITEGSAIYYIGEVNVSDAETLIFSINVKPVDETESFSIRYMRQFFAD